jgi:hypothetical protein
MNAMDAAAERSLASPEREEWARALFPLTMTPEEYAARHGAEWVCFSFDDYRYRDERLDVWVQQLGSILFTPGRLNACQEAILTPEELRTVRARGARYGSVGL